MALRRDRKRTAEILPLPLHARARAIGHVGSDAAIGGGGTCKPRLTAVVPLRSATNPGLFAGHAPIGDPVGRSGRSASRRKGAPSPAVRYFRIPSAVCSCVPDLRAVDRKVPRAQPVENNPEGRGPRCGASGHRPWKQCARVQATHGSACAQPWPLCARLLGCAGGRRGAVTRRGPGSRGGASPGKLAASALIAAPGSGCGSSRRRPSVPIRPHWRTGQMRGRTGQARLPSGHPAIRSAPV